MIGDLLRPNEESISPLLPLTTHWSIVLPTRVAALDRTFEQRIAQYPELARCLVARAIQRSKNLSVNMAIVHQARVDVRLHMLLWHLAARWGRVRSDGTVLRLRLTHALLADLVAARRPTVTTALSELAPETRSPGLHTEDPSVYMQRAIDAAERADHFIAELQDSMLPVEVGDTTLRFVDHLSGLNVPSYYSLDAHLGWRPVSPFELSIGGQNLLNNKHLEFIPDFINTAPTEVKRTVYGSLTFRF